MKFAPKENYKITKANADGSEETVWTDKCSEAEASEVFNKIICEQSKIFHAYKGKIAWRIIRLYNAKGEQIAQES